MTCGQTLTEDRRVDREGQGRARTAPKRPAPTFRTRDARKPELLLLSDMRKRLGELLREQHAGLWELSAGEMARQAERYAEVMDSGTGRVLVAVDHADVPIGMIVVRLLDNPRIEPGRLGRIDDAWVEPEWRRRGVMRELVRVAAEYAQGSGYGRMMLDWSVKNVASARCWRGLGFGPMLVVGMASCAGLCATNEEGRT
jgi:ribosomal protein S18 acetylase RimI-like enzyme